MAHITVRNETTFDYPAIERALVALGATESEADALTDVLHVEGWGGVENADQSRDFTEAELRRMVAWLREFREEGAIARQETEDR